MSVEGLFFLASWEWYVVVNTCLYECEKVLILYCFVGAELRNCDFIHNFAVLLMILALGW